MRGTVEPDTLASPYFEVATVVKDKPVEVPKPKPPRGVAQVFVIDAFGKPVADGEFAFHQDGVVETGTLAADGQAAFSRIDPARPFLFEVKDRACAIRSGAFFNPDDPRIEYGGTWFDWTLVRDDLNPARDFWPHYQKEMSGQLRDGVDCFMQHEHITRRPIQVAKPTLAQQGKVVIRATPLRIRCGPFVRYTDHRCAVIWLETLTPALVRVRFRPTGARTDVSRYAPTVRVGGRHFAAVKLDGLAQDTFYDYTIELAPLPASGNIPLELREGDGVFPKLTKAVELSMSDQLTPISLSKTAWLAFRTLVPQFTKLRFATGSCRWFPGDLNHKKESAGPDMLVGLANWFRTSPRNMWPHFLFFGGDQIYADEIGLNHGLRLARARFAARIPGPVDRNALRDKLVDGAWAGRFAHRFHEFAYPNEAFRKQVRSDLEVLDQTRKDFPDLQAIHNHYPDLDRREALKQRHTTLKNRRENTGAKGEASDERKARQTLEALGRAERLETVSEPFRAARFHWIEGWPGAAWRNPMSAKLLVHNFALWSLPTSESHLPTVTRQGGWTIARKPGGQAHPSAERGLHAADFAEYAFLYERAWTGFPVVRTLLAHVPTFLMFDDHEATDDWNFDVAWVRMLHNEKDEFRMWPKTLTDALAAYWVYQGWCNKAPGQWPATDPRVVALDNARRSGTDALPELRRVIHAACFTPVPSKDPKASYQTGLSLDWHYRLPFDPPFLVPDCRTRRLMVPADDKIRQIDHEAPTAAPQSQTIDDRQLAWIRRILVDEWRGGRAAFIAPSTPLLLKKKFMNFMQKPEIAAGAWARGNDIAGIVAAVFDSTIAAVATDAMLHVFRRGRDLEHMIRDRSWRSFWGLVEDMRAKGSAVKTLVLVSGDVHHSYCMTANASAAGRPTPEILQITCSGFQTTIRGSKISWLAEQLSSLPFDVGKRRLVPGFVQKNGTGSPDLVLFENTAAIVDVTMGTDVDVEVTYLTASMDAQKQVRQIYKYTSHPRYLKSNGEAAVAL
jgi:hypothetical protein